MSTSPSSTSSSEAPAREYGRDDLVPSCTERATTGLRMIVPLFAAVFFMGTITAGGIIDAVRPMEAPRIIGREKEEREARARNARFADGTLFKLFEEDRRLRSVIKHVSLPYYAGLLYLAFKETDPTIVAGEDDWLFLRQRLMARTAGAERLVEWPAAMLSALRRRLALNGTHLVVMPVPRKGRVYGDRLETERFNIRPELLSLLTDACRKRGLTIVDLERIYLEHAEETVYFKTDSHWSNRGALLAAQAAADAAGITVPPEKRKTILRNLPPKAITGGLVVTAGLFTRDGLGFPFFREKAEVIRACDPASGSVRL